MASYLQHAQIGVILGDTLFVHGAVEERALGFIPSPLTRYKLNSTSAWREPKCLDWSIGGGFKDVLEFSPRFYWGKDSI